MSDDIVKKLIEDAAAGYNVRDEVKRQHEIDLARQASRTKTLSEAITEMTWTCKHCGQTHPPVAMIDPETNQPYELRGRPVYIPVRECQCETVQAQQEARAKAEFDYAKATHRAWLENERAWQAYDTEWPAEAEAQARLRVVKQRVFDWYMQPYTDGGASGLLLAGHCGCGKTMLLRAVYRAYGNQGKPVKLVTEPELVSKITDRTLDTYFTTDCKLAKVLILDDLGREEFDQYSGWIQNRLQSFYFTVLEGRAAGCYTLASTNHRLEELTVKMGGAAIDRLQHSIGSRDNWLTMWDVPSYRIKDF